MQAASGAVVVVASLRVGLVAHFKPVTMGALLQHSSFAVIGGTVVVLLSLTVVGVVIAAPGSYLLASDHPTRRVLAGYVLFLGLLVAIGLFGDLALWGSENSVVFFLFVGSLLGALWVTGRAVSEIPAVRGFLRTSPFTVAVLATVGLGLLLVALYHAGVAEPWHQGEELVYSPTGEGDQVIYGFVLRDTGGWITVMRDSDREIVTFATEDLKSRSEW